MIALVNKKSLTVWVLIGQYTVIFKRSLRCRFKKGATVETQIAVNHVNVGLLTTIVLREAKCLAVTKHRGLALLTMQLMLWDLVGLCPQHETEQKIKLL